MYASLNRILRPSIAAVSNLINKGSKWVQGFIPPEATLEPTTDQLITQVEYCYKHHSLRKHFVLMNSCYRE